MKFDPKEINDNRVLDWDGWLDDLEDIPGSGGIFLFVDDKQEVKYIGWAPDGRLQEKARQAWDAGKGKGATQGGWMRCFSDAKAESLCNDLIAKYKPANN